MAFWVSLKIKEFLWTKKAQHKLDEPVYSVIRINVKSQGQDNIREVKNAENLDKYVLKFYVVCI